MKVDVLYRVPDKDSVTVIIDSDQKVFSMEEYVKIIKPAGSIPGTGADYIKGRNQLLNDYFINGEKPQFSW